MIPILIGAGLSAGFHFWRMARIEKKLDQILQKEQHMSETQDKEIDLLGQIKQGIADAAARMQAKIDQLLAASEDPTKSAAILAEMQADVTALGALGS